MARNFQLEIHKLLNIDAVFLGCTKLSPGFSVVGYKNLLGILGLFESLGCSAGPVGKIDIEFRKYKKSRKISIWDILKKQRHSLLIIHRLRSVKTDFVTFGNSNTNFRSGEILMANIFVKM